MRALWPRRGRGSTVLAALALVVLTVLIALVPAHDPLIEGPEDCLGPCDYKFAATRLQPPRVVTYGVGAECEKALPFDVEVPAKKPEQEIALYEYNLKVTAPAEAEPVQLQDFAFLVEKPTKPVCQLRDLPFCVHCPKPPPSPPPPCNLEIEEIQLPVDKPVCKLCDLPFCVHFPQPPPTLPPPCNLEIQLIQRPPEKPLCKLCDLPFCIHSTKPPPPPPPPPCNLEIEQIQIPPPKPLCKLCDLPFCIHSPKPPSPPPPPCNLEIEQIQLPPECPLCSKLGDLPIDIVTARAPATLQLLDLNFDVDKPAQKAKDCRLCGLNAAVDLIAVPATDCPPSHAPLALHDCRYGTTIAGQSDLQMSSLTHVLDELLDSLGRITSTARATRELSPYPGTVKSPKALHNENTLAAPDTASSDPNTGDPTSSPPERSPVQIARHVTFDPEIVKSSTRIASDIFSNQQDKTPSVSFTSDSNRGLQGTSSVRLTRSVTPGSVKGNEDNDALTVLRNIASLVRVSREPPSALKEESTVRKIRDVSSGLEVAKSSSAFASGILSGLQDMASAFQKPNDAASGIEAAKSSVGIASGAITGLMDLTSSSFRIPSTPINGFGEISNIRVPRDVSSGLDLVNSCAGIASNVVSGLQDVASSVRIVSDPIFVPNLAKSSVGMASDIISSLRDMTPLVRVTDDPNSDLEVAKSSVGIAGGVISGLQDISSSLRNPSAPIAGTEGTSSVRITRDVNPGIDLVNSCAGIASNVISGLQNMASSVRTESDPNFVPKLAKSSVGMASDIISSLHELTPLAPVPDDPHSDLDVAKSFTDFTSELLSGIQGMASSVRTRRDAIPALQEASSIRVKRHIIAGLEKAYSGERFDGEVSSDPCKTSSAGQVVGDVTSGVEEKGSVIQLTRDAASESFLPEGDCPNPGVKKMPNTTRIPAVGENEERIVDQNIELSPTSSPLSCRVPTRHPDQRDIHSPCKSIIPNVETTGVGAGLTQTILRNVHSIDFDHSTTTKGDSETAKTIPLPCSSHTDPNNDFENNEQTLNTGSNGVPEHRGKPSPCYAQDKEENSEDKPNPDSTLLSNTLKSGTKNIEGTLEAISSGLNLSEEEVYHNSFQCGTSNDEDVVSDPEFPHVRRMLKHQAILEGSERMDSQYLNQHLTYPLSGVHEQIFENANNGNDVTQGGSTLVADVRGVGGVVTQRNLDLPLGDAAHRQQESLGPLIMGLKGAIQKSNEDESISWGRPDENGGDLFDIIMQRPGHEADFEEDAPCRKVGKGTYSCNNLEEERATLDSKRDFEMERNVNNIVIVESLVTGINPGKVPGYRATGTQPLLSFESVNFEEPGRTDISDSESQFATGLSHNGLMEIAGNIKSSNPDKSVSDIPNFRSSYRILEEPESWDPIQEHNEGAAEPVYGYLTGDDWNGLHCIKERISRSENGNKGTAHTIEGDPEALGFALEPADGNVQGHPFENLGHGLVRLDEGDGYGQASTLGVIRSLLAAGDLLNTEPADAIGSLAYGAEVGLAYHREDEEVNTSSSELSDLGCQRISAMDGEICESLSNYFPVPGSVITLGVDTGIESRNGPLERCDPPGEGSRIMHGVTQGYHTDSEAEFIPNSSNYEHVTSNTDFQNKNGNLASVTDGSLLKYLSNMDTTSNSEHIQVVPQTGYNGLPMLLTQGYEYLNEGDLEHAILEEDMQDRLGSETGDSLLEDSSLYDAYGTSKQRRYLPKTDYENVRVDGSSGRSNSHHTRSSSKSPHRREHTKHAKKCKHKLAQQMRDYIANKMFGDWRSKFQESKPAFTPRSETSREPSSTPYWGATKGSENARGGQLKEKFTNIGSTRNYGTNEIKAIDRFTQSIGSSNTGYQLIQTSDEESDLEKDETCPTTDSTPIKNKEQGGTQTFGTRMADEEISTFKADTARVDSARIGGQGFAQTQAAPLGGFDEGGVETYPMDPSPNERRDMVFDGNVGEMQTFETGAIGPEMHPFGNADRTRKMWGIGQAPPPHYRNSHPLIPAPPPLYDRVRGYSEPQTGVYGGLGGGAERYTPPDIPPLTLGMNTARAGFSVPGSGMYANEYDGAFGQGTVNVKSLMDDLPIYNPPAIAIQKGTSGGAYGQGYGFFSEGDFTHTGFGSRGVETNRDFVDRTAGGYPSTPAGLAESAATWTPKSVGSIRYQSPSTIFDSWTNNADEQIAVSADFGQATSGYPTASQTYPPRTNNLRSGTGTDIDWAPVVYSNNVADRFGFAGRPVENIHHPQVCPDPFINGVRREDNVEGNPQQYLIALPERTLDRDFGEPYYLEAMLSGRTSPDSFYGSEGARARTVRLAEAEVTPLSEVDVPKIISKKPGEDEKKGFICFPIEDVLAAIKPDKLKHILSSIASHLPRVQPGTGVEIDAGIVTGIGAEIGAGGIGAGVGAEGGTGAGVGLCTELEARVRAGVEAGVQGGIGGGIGGRTGGRKGGGGRGGTGGDAGGRVRAGVGGEVGGGVGGRIGGGIGGGVGVGLGLCKKIGAGVGVGMEGRRGTGVGAEAGSGIEDGIRDGVGSGIRGGVGVGIGSGIESGEEIEVRACACRKGKETMGAAGVDVGEGTGAEVGLGIGAGVVTGKGVRSGIGAGVNTRLLPPTGLWVDIPTGLWLDLRTGVWIDPKTGIVVGRLKAPDARQQISKDVQIRVPNKEIEE